MQGPTNVTFQAPSWRRLAGPVAIPYEPCPLALHSQACSFLPESHHRGHRFAMLSRLSVFVASLSFACAAWAHTPAAPANTSTAVQIYTLKNGMALWVIPDHRAATAVQMLWVRVGSADEVDGSSGVAHVLEHMMFKGTPKLAEGEFSKRVAAMGGEDNAFTSYDYTAYYQKVPAARLPDVMAMEADRFAYANFSDAAFAKEIEVIKEERRMRVDDQPRAAMREMMDAVQWSASPYRRPVIGWMNDLEHMQAEDARHFLRTWYAPHNAALVIAGDVQAEQVKAWADKYYGPIQPRQALPQRKPRQEPPQQGPRRMVHEAEVAQPMLRMAYKIPSLAEAGLALSANSPLAQDIYALLMLAEVLDGYEAARLPKALTQGQGRVADSVSAHMGLLGRGPEAFVLQGVPAEGRSVAELEQALRKSLAQIAQQGVSELELARVKKQYAAAQIFKRDSVMGQAQEVGMLWALGLPPDGMAHILAQLEAVTAAQVQSVAQRYFSDAQLTVGELRPKAQ